MMRSCIKDNRGISLVELVIGMGLLSLVIAVAYSLYFFGTTSFQTGANRVDLQQNARLMADFITEEVRLARVVNILDGSDGFNALLEDYDYIYLDEETDSIMHRKSGGTPVVKFSTISQKVDFDLVFSKSSSNEVVVFTVYASDVNREYAVTAEVLILNMRGSSIGGDEVGIGLQYNYPPELD